MEGKTQNGELFEVDGEEVGIRIKGREYRFLINRFIPSDRRYISEWSKVDRCHRCSQHLGSSPYKEAGSYKFHQSCFKCLVCNKEFKGGEKLKRDEWGGMVHAFHFDQAKMCDTCSRIISTANLTARQVLKDGRITCQSCCRTNCERQLRCLCSCDVSCSSGR